MPEHMLPVRLTHVLSRASSSAASSASMRSVGHAASRLHARAIRSAFAIIAPLLLSLLVGCEAETKIIKYRPFLAGLPGAETGSDVTASPTSRSALLKESNVSKIRTIDDDGNVKLTARNGRDLIVHIYETIRDNEKDIFTRQVLSQSTREEYVKRGFDPGKAFDDLRARSDDIVDLFNAMPQGELTPGIFLKPIGKNRYRLQVSGLAARDLKWTSMDVVSERGNFSLLWFGRPSVSR